MDDGWSVLFTDDAARDMENLRRSLGKDYTDKLRGSIVSDLLGSFHAKRDIVKLRGLSIEGRPVFRLRKGKFRVLFIRIPSSKMIIVLRILPRKKAYR